MVWRGRLLFCNFKLKVGLALSHRDNEDMSFDRGRRERERDTHTLARIHSLTLTHTHDEEEPPHIAVCESYSTTT